MNLTPPDPEDDRDADPEEIETASERTPISPAPPEIPSKLEELTEWDTPVDAAGEKVPETGLEDETSAAEKLVEEGVDEADRDQRIASADPDFEP